MNASEAITQVDPTVEIDTKPRPQSCNDVVFALSISFAGRCELPARRISIQRQWGKYSVGFLKVEGAEHAVADRAFGNHFGAAAGIAVSGSPRTQSVLYCGSALSVTHGGVRIFCEAISGERDGDTRRARTCLMLPQLVLWRLQTPTHRTAGGRRARRCQLPR